MTSKKKRRSSAGVAIGGIVAGIEQQIFRTTPPVNELVAKGTPLRAIAASGGGTLDVTFPDDAATDGPEDRPTQQDNGTASESASSPA